MIGAWRNRQGRLNLVFATITLCIVDSSPKEFAMSPRENLQSLLNGFAHDIGLSELPLDANGLGTLLFDDTIMLHLQINETTGTFILFSTIGTVPEQGRESFYADMLQANLFWQQTGGATLALEKSSQAAVLAYEQPLEGLDQAGFQGLIKQFLDVVEDWQGRLRDVGAGDRLDSGHDDPSATSGESFIRV
ncbi:MAG TPA: type III secretion system chaperone [Candidatus Competibacteraceae bacterium]|nr:type III secretion system chaperone [Candidatus Competibacteraceae bacterium]HQA24749.1 type III secretion system chaperone [Candidatus Competibacteraceae bacterium]HQD55497.1 type III secretion system chaperone [Candidatus Competibacteraceae bacterium]